MKRISAYALLTSLIMFCFYSGLRCAFGLFTSFNYYSAIQDLKKGKIQIVEFGELPLHFEQKQNLATSYGFNFHQLGCNPPCDMINGSRYYNKVMIDRLERKYGVGWWSKFQAKLDSIDQSKSTDSITKKAIEL